jgi:hypothetical protein
MWFRPLLSFLSIAICMERACTLAQAYTPICGAAHDSTSKLRRINQCNKLLAPLHIRACGSRGCAANARRLGRALLGGGSGESADRRRLRFGASDAAGGRPGKVARFRSPNVLTASLRGGGAPKATATGDR